MRTKRTFGLAGWRTGGFLAAALFASEVAGADLFRCQSPDGTTVYTDSQANCPGAKPHEPSGAVQRVGPATSHAPAAAAGEMWQTRPAARPSASDEDALAAQWRARKDRAEQELREVDTRLGELHQFVVICNRGGSLYRERVNGLRQTVPCSELESEVVRLESRRGELQSYLGGQLEEECRRSGCLPGWLR